MDHRGRLKKLQTVFERDSLDALLVTHLPNIRYLCGFTGTSGVLAIFETGSVFLTDGRYSEQARAEVQGPRIVVAGKAPLAAASGWLMENRSKLGRKKPHRLGIEAEHLTVAGRTQLASFLRSDFRLRETRGLVEQARMVKDVDEIARLRAAVSLGASLFDRALDVIRPGVSESEVAAEMEYTARKAGAEDMSFPTIVAAGKRSALPHGRASRAAIPSRGFVVCDFGVILSGYCSDRRHFTHSTGHGVGLEIHEPPRIAAGQSEILRPGMVITIEPGVYIAGRGGVRIEDMVVVTEQGCEILAPGSKELITI
jgi:Xaa-Pro aminopeptidase